MRELYKMIEYVKNIKKKILNGNQIERKRALKLISINNDNKSVLHYLFEGANQIRKKYNSDQVNLCTIINAKSGNCSEDCKFCAQSAHYDTDIDNYELLNYNRILVRARKVEKAGAHRFSLVTSGKKLDNSEFQKVIDIYKKLSQEVNLDLCASHGKITYEQALKLKKAGVKMYHHNVETCKDYYSQICTTHSYTDRLKNIEVILKSGLDICCGGIIGLGETREDRVKMAFEIKNLGIKSIPINVLTPIPGTPLEDSQVLSPLEILKTIAVYRFIIPDGIIRYAGGRSALADKQNIGFRAGVNAALVGDFLTTVGSNIKEDKEMIRNEGLEIPE